MEHAIYNGTGNDRANFGPDLYAKMIKREGELLFNLGRDRWGCFQVYDVDGVIVAIKEDSWMGTRGNMQSGIDSACISARDSNQLEDFLKRFSLIERVTPHKRSYPVKASDGAGI